ncbi:hypothetical protein BC834DRAFT_967165 [Gloeopeniophorella convolvens]|nr:hypothetical protein BC834DRAFT_967165 [Gloeopeniophorella convolvens]
MSAAARAEARRKAILSRGSDRLSKLTTSARGDDAPQFVHDDPPVPPLPSAPRGDLASFIGEDPLPTPPAAPRAPRGAPDARTSPFDSLGLGGAPPDPSVWSNEQQQQLLQALLGGVPQSGARSPAAGIAGTNDAVPDDPLMALMSSLGGGPGMGGKGVGAIPGMAPPRAGPKPKTRAQKLIPLLHIVAVWALVAFFVFWREPEVFSMQNTAAISSSNIWRRWAELASGPPEKNVWSVEAVAFFWAFASLELALHSMRIFSGLDSTQPPMLLALALPHLPKPFPSIIVHGLKYLQMAGALLDDFAAALVAFGLFIAASAIYSDWSLS